MDALQIYLVFFGIPVAILGLGMRRTAGTARMLALLLLSVGAGLYGLAAETISAAVGYGLPVPTHPGWSRARMLFPLSGAAAFVGALGVVLVRCRPRASGP